MGFDGEVPVAMKFKMLVSASFPATLLAGTAQADEVQSVVAQAAALISTQPVVTPAPQPAPAIFPLSGIRN